MIFALLIISCVFVVLQADPPIICGPSEEYHECGSDCGPTCACRFPKTISCPAICVHCPCKKRLYSELEKRVRVAVRLQRFAFFVNFWQGSKAIGFILEENICPKKSKPWRDESCDSCWGKKLWHMADKHRKLRTASRILDIVFLHISISRYASFLVKGQATVRFLWEFYV